MKYIFAILLIYTTLDKPQELVKYDSIVRRIASANMFDVSTEVERAIYNAARRYKIDVAELTAIAIIESSLGNNAKTRVNINGTTDTGLFQINTVNVDKCLDYDIMSHNGNALCAARLLSGLKARRADYLGVYHSKTKDKKMKYMQKITKVLSKQVR